MCVCVCVCVCVGKKTCNPTRSLFICSPFLPQHYAATKKQMEITDMTNTNLVTFRKTVYLTIMSSLDFEECAHKLLKMTIKPGLEVCFHSLFFFKKNLCFICLCVLKFQR